VLMMPCTSLSGCTNPSSNPIWWSRFSVSTAWTHMCCWVFFWTTHVLWFWTVCLLHLSCTISIPDTLLRRIAVGRLLTTYTIHGTHGSSLVIKVLEVFLTPTSPKTECSQQGSWSFRISSLHQA
jgi:hypothetical protein